MKYLDEQGLAHLWGKIKEEFSGSGGLSEEEVQSLINSKGYQTAEEVQSLISTALGEVENGSY